MHLHFRYCWLNLWVIISSRKILCDVPTNYEIPLYFLCMHNIIYANYVIIKCTILNTTGGVKRLFILINAKYTGENRSIRSNHEVTTTITSTTTPHHLWLLQKQNFKTHAMPIRMHSFITNMHIIYLNCASEL